MIKVLDLPQLTQQGKNISKQKRKSSSKNKFQNGIFFN
jgi:hypothetical protein